jgi:hypothetical protein
MAQMQQGGGPDLGGLGEGSMHAPSGEDNEDSSDDEGPPPLEDAT